MRMSKEMMKIAKTCLEHKAKGGMCVTCSQCNICEPMLEVEIARTLLKELEYLDQYRFNARIGLFKFMPVVGQEVFFVVSGRYVYQYVEFVKSEKISWIKIDEDGNTYHTANKEFTSDDVGKTIFLTYEDAEKSRKKES